MSELRRLMICSKRLRSLSDHTINLSKEESHYLNNVLRMRSGMLINVIDGEGHLWTAEKLGDSQLKLCTPYEKPQQSSIRDKPLIGIAITIPKKGFADCLRMCTELGVDYIQPLLSDRSVVKNKSLLPRWTNIINEATEQSERLWKPELYEVQTFSYWIRRKSPNVSFCLSTTRKDSLQSINSWSAKQPKNVEEIWVAIGPEGGWDLQEEFLANESGAEFVKLGSYILQTSTAAVSAINSLINYRNR